MVRSSSSWQVCQALLLQPCAFYHALRSTAFVSGNSPPQLLDVFYSELNNELMLLLFESLLKWLSSMAPFKTFTVIMIIMPDLPVVMS